MKIICAGGGPGGLYAALLLKKSDPSRHITVIDRNPPDATYGWGVVFSDETLTFLRDADRPTYRAIRSEFVHWEAIDTFHTDELIRSGGHAFSGLSRQRLLRVLQERCASLGVDMQFENSFDHPSVLPEADLLVAADGFNSVIRQAHSEIFRPTFDSHGTRFIWLGLPLRLPAFTFDFRETEFGMFQAHAYPFADRMSTFIVECNEDVWKRADLENASEEQSLNFCARVFSERLEGKQLLSNRSTWIKFVTLKNETWRDGKIVLLGDAAHTAHFSIGSGTKMAMEDAIALSDALNRHRDMQEALFEYEELRQPVVERTQAAARESSMWFEHAPRYSRFEPSQFAFSLLTRSKRITYLSLRRRDSRFSDGVDASFWQKSSESSGVQTYPPPKPMLVPLSIARLTLSNRIVHQVIDPDCAVAGRPGDRHLVQIGAAAEGTGLVLTDMIAVSPEGRTTPGTAGLYDDAQQRAFGRMVRLVHQNGVRIGVVLGHAGARASTAPRACGTDVPLLGVGWETLAAGNVPYTRLGRKPRAMTRADMSRVRSDFVAAARRAKAAGFDLLQLHFGHGYLLAGFLSPLTNLRTDRYGGEINNRLRFPLEVLEAVRATWPRERPLSVCFSVSDWVKGGTSESEAVTIARALREHGADLVGIVSGQTTAQANPPYGRAWEAPLGDLIRNEADVPVLLGGNISSEDEVNTLLAAGRADLCIISPAKTRW
jgi:anthraniloyl-CoA monooxygenase